jgi:hypothetical protein
MALVRFGNSGPVFGLATETTGYAQDASIKTSNEKATIEDEVGQTVTVGYFNTLYSGSFTLVDKSGATLPSMLTAIAVANVTECAKVVIFEQERKPEQKGYQKRTYTYEAYASITY